MSDNRQNHCVFPVIMSENRQNQCVVPVIMSEMVERKRLRFLLVWVMQASRFFTIQITKSQQNQNFAIQITKSQIGDFLCRDLTDP